MMNTAVIATKQGMTQAWTTNGKRLAVTRCIVEPLHVLAQHDLRTKATASTDDKQTYFEVGFGTKKLKNMDKPLRTKLEKGGFSFGVRHIRGLQLPVEGENPTTVGQTVNLFDTLAVGDIVKVQGTTKGRGFAGAMKRHGFKGVGGRTHGQSDRQRAVGSIGSGTTPGRVLKGKRMPGHYGDETQTVAGLVVLYINPETNELWLSGPVPGANNSVLTIRKTGMTKSVDLDLTASGLSTPVVLTQDKAEVSTNTAEATASTEEVAA